MQADTWRARAGSSFECEKRPASGRRGMVVTNHPLASAAGAEMLAGGGNAVDAAVAALFTLSVVEPMMVGIFYGGTALIRLPDGREVVLDGLALAPAGAKPDSYVPVSDSWPTYMEVEGRRNAVGASSVAVPGNLMGWCEALDRFGRLDLASVTEAAIRHASKGFRATPYLVSSIEANAVDFARDPEISAVFMPGGTPLRAGEKVFQGAYAETLRTIAAEGPKALYQGALGRHAAGELEKQGAFLRFADLQAYRTIDRTAVRGTYRGYEVVGPPPPCSGGVHIAQMLNVLEGFDISAIGFGTPQGVHLLLEALKIAASDRRASTADPAFVDVPVERLMSKDYAAARRAEIDPNRAGTFAARVLSNESANTTHVTVADGDGLIITSTQTINSLFGARMMIPGTGIIPNNYMYLFDPHPGNALSLVPGKRITSTQSPTIIYKDGEPRFALGLPGGPRLYGSAMQAVVNLLDHGMTLQEAVEAPRVWSQGQDAEMEEGFAPAVRAGVGALGHPVVTVPHVAGGMCAIQFEPDGSMTGAACWRADGTPIGIGGGLARTGTLFWPDYRRR